MSFGDLTGVAQTACLGPEALPLTEAVTALGGHWFTSEESLLEHGEGGITALNARCGGGVARAAQGNTALCGLAEIAGQPFLSFPAGKNAGFVADLGQLRTRVSLALVHADPVVPKQAPGTLCAFACNDGESTFLLEDRGKGMRLTNRDGDPAVMLPESAGPRLSFLVFDAAGGRYAPAGGAAAVLPWPAAFAAGAGQLFIGCRRDSAGLLKTQGAATIADVIAFPERDILAPDMARLRARLAAYLQEVFTDGL